MTVSSFSSNFLDSLTSAPSLSSRLESCSLASSKSDWTLRNSRSDSSCALIASFKELSNSAFSDPIFSFSDEYCTFSLLRLCLTSFSWFKAVCSFSLDLFVCSIHSDSIRVRRDSISFACFSIVVWSVNSKFSRESFKSAFKVSISFVKDLTRDSVVAYLSSFSWIFIWRVSISCLNFLISSDRCDSTTGTKASAADFNAVIVAECCFLSASSIFFILIVSLR
mmetsp:Transcript_64204/g.71912  ORF Transcript_64204/g.71912 Transcript_64204/m.71912 type:complete len:223 (+) Transcript_64204:833-1501(+)